MGDMTKEPSMEDILSSIKRIIAEEGEEAVQAPSRKSRADLAPSVPDAAPVDEVLELTEEAAAEDVMPVQKTPRSAKLPPQPEDNSILSVESEVAARQSLSALSSMLVSPKDGEDNTLDGLVRSMLKPMLKEWLDARLPQLVEEMVAKEIARITAR